MGVLIIDKVNRLWGLEFVSIFDSKPNISKMVGDIDVENLAHLVEFGNPSFERDENRRREAVDALGSLTDQRAIVPLEGALQDENGRVRVSAVSALERHKAFDSLFTALHSKDNEVRRAAA